jgi:hypothetical protein
MSYIDELKELSKQKDEGKLTEEEFQEKKEEILSQSSKTKENKTESGNKKKKGFIARILEDKLDDRLETVTKLFSTDQEALKEWKKYKRQYKNKRITLTALRKKAKELKNEGYALTKTSIESDMASMSVKRELKRQGFEGKLLTRKETWDLEKIQIEKWDKENKERVNKKSKENWDLIKNQVLKILNSNKEISFLSDDIIDILEENGFDTSRLVFQSFFGVPEPSSSVCLRILLNDFGKKSGINSRWDGGSRNMYYYIGEDERIYIGEQQEKEKEEKRVKNLKLSIPKLLRELGTKIPASDIDAHLKHKNVDEIKEVCEDMYHSGKINRTSNYRYFVLTEKKKKTSTPKSVSVADEIKKFSVLKDQGIITQEEFDIKKKELLGL